MVVMPVTYEQPGVGARLECAGVGRSIPVARLTLERLRVAVRTVLGDPAYRARAGLRRSSIKAADGLNRAADLIEGAFTGAVGQKIRHPRIRKWRHVQHRGCQGSPDPVGNRSQSIMCAKQDAVRRP